MNKGNHSDDLILAQETCIELRAGNNEAILSVYNKYQPFFVGFTRRRLHSFGEDKATSVLTDFWVEMLNAKAICGFQGLSSLKTYLFKILNFRIVDKMRRANRKYSYNNIRDNDQDIDEFGADDVSPEKDLIHREKIRLIHETLLIMAKTSVSDANLVKMHLEGLNYQQMAERELSSKTYAPKELKKRTDAIKKQFTRKISGSLAKFKGCLEHVMRKNQLIYEDLFN